MKHTHTSLYTVLIGALTCAGFPLASAQTVYRVDNNRPVVISAPAVQNGSNWSRAPFPAERRFDDVKPADGKAIDDLPPNTPATNIEPPLPEARIAIMQSTTPGIGDPALLPTGRVATTTSYGAPAYAVAQVRDGSKPVIISPPAVQNGSNWSRAPFPSERRFDDVKPADGQAIDNLPPNTPATNTEPPVPEPRVAILQPAPAPAAVADPVLLPTGRVAVATSFDAATVTPTIRTATVSNREQVLADIESRIVASETSVASMRSTASQMGTEARRQFNAASDDVKEKAKALRKSLAAARKANAQDWESAKAQLSSDFEAYGAALGRIDSAAAAR